MYSKAHFLNTFRLFEPLRVCLVSKYAKSVHVSCWFVTPQNVRKFSMGIKTQNLHYAYAYVFCRTGLIHMIVLLMGGWGLFQPFALKKYFPVEVLYVCSVQIVSFDLDKYVSSYFLFS